MRVGNLRKLRNPDATETPTREQPPALIWPETTKAPGLLSWLYRAAIRVASCGSAVAVRKASWRGRDGDAVAPLAENGIRLRPGRVEMTFMSSPVTVGMTDFDGGMPDHRLRELNVPQCGLSPRHPGRQAQG